MRKYMFVLLQFVATIFLASCSAQARPAFEKDVFKTPVGKISDLTLCFDLRNSQNPISGVIFYVSPTIQEEINTLILPFETSQGTGNEDIYSTWGSYDNITIIQYYSTPQTQGLYNMTFIPTINTVPDGAYDLSSLDGFIFLHNVGLEYTFEYKYPDEPKNKWQSPLLQTTPTQFDTIAIAFPDNARFIGIDNSGKTEKPLSLYNIGNTRFYSATSLQAGEEAIRVKYELPPSQSQVIFIKFVGGLIGVLFVPTLKWLNIPSLRNRKKLSIVFFVVEAGLVIYFLYVAITNFQTSSMEAISGLVIALAGGILTTFVEVKGKTPEDIK